MGSFALRRRYSLSALAVGLGAVIVLASSARVGQPLFEIQPDPPVAGSDVNVTYYGNSNDMVSFSVGDGEDQQPKIGKDKKFTIPKALLKAGLKLTIQDESRAPHSQATVCFVIEPKG